MLRNVTQSSYYSALYIVPVCIHVLSLANTFTHTSMNLLSCCIQVAHALTTAGEHKKALEQAERIEQEFVSLMTGRKEGRHQKTPPQEREPYEVCVGIS